ncbi:MAG: MerR family transcriptional regulator [Nitrospinae bacterium]|nr:MerR family transcriptional regulator [Nitrospinota bacterium]
MPPLTIGKAAKLAGVGVETVRFYEREGLVPEPPRRQSGYRQYPAETVQRIRFIRRAKDIGFTLKEIREMLGLRVDASAAATCDAARKLAEEKIADVRGKISTLRRMETVLARLVDCCKKRSASSECPILETLIKEGSDGNKRIKPKQKKK